MKDIQIKAIGDPDYFDFLYLLIAMCYSYHRENCILIPD